MWLLLASCIILVLSNFSMATITNEPSNSFDQCKIVGDKCQETNDCCSDLTCYSTQSMFS
jgi:hypothetical protein